MVTKMAKDLIYSIVLVLVGFIFGIAFYPYISNNNVPFNEEESNYILNQNSISVINTVEFPLVAVRSSGEGVLETAKLYYTKGDGGIFMKINPFVESDTQYVLETAIKYVCNKYKFKCDNKDFYLEINSSAQLVGGPSAGLAFALATYYLLSNKSFPDLVAATGTIDNYGNIYRVGGIFEKALAAAESGKKVFIVPIGQSVVYDYERIEKTRRIAPGFYITEVYYRPVPINISEYFYDKYGMYVLEVSSVDDAISALNYLYR